MNSTSLSFGIELLDSLTSVIVIMVFLSVIIFFVATVWPLCKYLFWVDDNEDEFDEEESEEKLEIMGEELKSLTEGLKYFNRTDDIQGEDVPTHRNEVVVQPKEEPTRRTQEEDLLLDSIL